MSETQAVPLDAPVKAIQFEKPQDTGEIIIGGKALNFEALHKERSIGNDTFASIPGNADDIVAIVTPSGIDVNLINTPISNFGFNAHLYGPPWGKTVKFNILLKAPEMFPKTKGRYPNFPSGNQLVTAAMKYFDRHHRIKRFSAVWPEYSDNFIQFEQNKQNGQNDRDAAMNTWSGINVAIPFNFSKTVVVKPGEYKKTYKDEKTGEIRTSQKAYYVDYYR